MPDRTQLATAPDGQAAALLPEPAPAIACPRCHQPLIDPHGLGWCKSCGFCKSLEQEKGNQLLAVSGGPTYVSVFAGAAGNIPMWFWVQQLGILAMAGFSFAVGYLLPAGNTFPRALWTTVQLGVGFLLIFAGQLAAVVLIAPEDEKLSFKDAMMPTRLWVLVSKRLPRCCTCLWISTWGLALMVSALFFIGGLKYWYKYMPNNSKNAAALKAGAR